LDRHCITRDSVIREASLKDERDSVWVGRSDHLIQIRDPAKGCLESYIRRTLLPAGHPTNGYSKGLGTPKGLPPWWISSSRKTPSTIGYYRTPRATKSDRSVHPFRRSRPAA